MSKEEYLKILDGVERLYRTKERSKDFSDGVSMVLDVLEIYKPKQ